VRRLKGARFEYLIWIGQENAKNRTATDEAVKEQTKVTGQQIDVANFMYRHS
jgi:hypothetical protein